MLMTVGNTLSAAFQQGVEFQNNPFTELRHSLVIDKALTAANTGGGNLRGGQPSTC